MSDPYEQVERAITAMRQEFEDNAWMLNEHWPLNEPHVRLMISDVMSRFPPASQVRLLDVGCFNGYISFIFKQLGYDVIGTDVYEQDRRQDLFNRIGVKFFRSNLNDVKPLEALNVESFDVVIIAQVIEHILNHPLGLMRSLTKAIRPNGLMIVTTPNPANIMNAVRVLRGRSLLWGTGEFITERKIDNGQIISQGDIHYREYTNEELVYLLQAAGLKVERSRYLGLGNSCSQPAWKRFVKSNFLVRNLMSHRLLASNHYLLARKVQPA